jgi:hypothetical protein
MHHTMHYVHEKRIISTTYKRANLAGKLNLNRPVHRSNGQDLSVLPTPHPPQFTLRRPEKKEK